MNLCNLRISTKIRFRKKYSKSAISEGLQQTVRLRFENLVGDKRASAAVKFADIIWKLLMSVLYVGPEKC